MRKTKKKMILTTAIAAFSLCLVGGAYAMNNVTASATGEVTVKTIPSASVRIATSENSGIRFAAKLNGYDPATAAEGVKYGMLIVPYEMADGFSDDFIENLEISYPTIDFAYDYCVPYQAGKTIASLNDQEGYYIVSSLVNLNEGNYTRDFVAISYSEVNGERTYVADWESCKRNITQVANGVYDDYDPEDEDDLAKIAILDTFLEKGLAEKDIDANGYQIPLKDTSFSIVKDEAISIVDESNPMYLVYTVEDEGVAKYKDGEIVGVGGGETTVTVRYGKYTAECTVSVSDPTIYDAEDGATNVVTKQNISSPHIETIMEDGEERKVLSVSYTGGWFPQLVIKTSQDLSNVESISYMVKVAGENSVGLLPNIPGSAQDRSDGYAWTKSFLGDSKTNLTAADGWTKVTVSGLKGINTKAPKDSGSITANMPTISYDETTGLYGVWFAWIARDGSNTNYANTLYLDDFKVESRFDAELLKVMNACDEMSTLSVGVSPSNFSTSAVTGSVVQDSDRGSVLQVVSTSGAFAVIKVTTSMDLSAYTSAANTFSLTYWIKAKATGNETGLFFLPAVAGCTGNRGDQCTTTKTLLGQDTLTTADGWKQVTISGLYVGLNYTNTSNGTVFNGVVDNGDGTYSIYFHYINRSNASTNITSTILMDEVKIVK